MPDCGQYLHQFALSVDSVDQNSYERITKSLRAYFLERQGALFFDVLMDGFRVERDNELVPGLKSAMPSDEEQIVVPVFNADQTYRGQRAYAYHKGTPLWITASDQGPLKLVDERGAAWVDSWGNTPEENLPPYQAPPNEQARTSILVPLRYGPRVFGVLVVEFKEHIECSTPGKVRIEKIAESAARIMWLRETTRNQLQDTKRAFEDVERVLTNATNGLKKPELFIASSKDADEQVMGQILEVVDRFKDQVETVDWRKLSDVGSVTRDLTRRIDSAQFGICYLSERLQDISEGAKPFRDNPNVLFEAGMLHALMHDSDAEPKGWIPIREHEEFTGAPPFDIADTRMVVVPRAAGDLTVNGDAFKRRLTEMLSTLLI